MSTSGKSWELPFVRAHADAFADVEHRRFVALALADDDGAVDGNRVHLVPHRFDGDLIGLVTIALAHRVCTGDRRLFHDTDEVERQIGIHVRIREVAGRSVPVSTWSSLCSLHGRQLTARRPVRSVAEQVVGLHQLVDFAGPFVDHRTLAIPIVAPDRVIVRIAVGAVDLHRITGGPLGGDGGKPFRQTRSRACCGVRRSSASRHAARGGATPDSRTPSSQSSP